MINKTFFQLLTALIVALSLCCSVHSLAIKAKSKKLLSKKIIPEPDAGNDYMPENRPSSEMPFDFLTSLTNHGGVDSEATLIDSQQMLPEELMSLMKKRRDYSMLPLLSGGGSEGDVPDDAFNKLMSRPGYDLMPDLMSKGTKVRGRALMSALASRSAKLGAVDGLKPADWLKLLIDCLQQLTETLDDYDELPKLWKKGR